MANPSSLIAGPCALPASQWVLVVSNRKERLRRALFGISSVDHVMYCDAVLPGSRRENKVNQYEHEAPREPGRGSPVLGKAS